MIVGYNKRTLTVYEVLGDTKVRTQGYRHDIIHEDRALIAYFLHTSHHEELI